MGTLTGINMGMLGRNHLVEGLVVFASAILVGRLAEWGLCTGAKRLGRWAHAEIGEEIFEMAARPLSYP